jgi:hypothetical protein
MTPCIKCSADQPAQQQCRLDSRVDDYDLAAMTDKPQGLVDTRQFRARCGATTVQTEPGAAHEQHVR